jgi:hypothetical protein
MCNDQKSSGHGSPAGCWTLAGGNTPGNRLATLRPGGALESIVGHPISPIPPHHTSIHPHPKSNGHQPKNFILGRCHGGCPQGGRDGITSQILIHRDFLFQGISKYFKEIQSNSKVFSFIIFLFFYEHLEPARPLWRLCAFA